ncbi:hypothetical protein MUP77_00870 [Candidatus Bathyarchaeota archaeon]|nr:hypothetical protein [Candidatus Bathyarchaeota archaeon]
MPEFRTSFEGYFSEEGKFHVSKMKDLYIGKDVNTKKGRMELIRALFRVFGELRTCEVENLLEKARVRHKSRVTLSGDLKSLTEEGSIEKVHKGFYRNKHPALFVPHEKDELFEFVKSCSYIVKEKTPKYPIGITYILSDKPRPKGLHYKFSDIGGKVLARCVQNILFSSYLRVAGQTHIPIVPCQLEGKAEIPEDWLEGIWREKAFKGKFLAAFLIDFQELRKWLKTEEGRNWLRDALQGTPKEFQRLASGIVKALEIIDKSGTSLEANEVAAKLEQLGVSGGEVGQIMTWILPYIDSEEIEGRVKYRISKEALNVVRGLLEIERGRDPAHMYELMKY